MADKRVGDLSITYNNSMLQEFVATARNLRMRATLRAVPFNLGGSSLATKIAQDAEPDRVGPAVTVDGMSYITPLNNETDGTQGP